MLLPAGIITSWAELGIPEGFQFAATLKLPPEGPTQVLVWAEIVKQKMLRIENNSSRFIIFGFRIILLHRNMFELVIIFLRTIALKAL